jgi:hypothetical protein
MESRVIAALEAGGPLTGGELVERLRPDVFEAWSCCRKSSRIRLSPCGRRFLRLDRAVPGYARLSPSIRREFLTYTVLGLESQHATALAKADSLRKDIRRISREKWELARATMETVVSSLLDPEAVRGHVCFLIAGDIAYDMSHTVPRPEKSTGTMVRGSDLDVIVVAEDDFSPGLVKSLDDAIHKRKHYLLVHPDYREEIDYLVKNVSRVKEQLRFDTFEHMVAGKILCEAEFLCGSEPLFREIKGLVEEYDIAQKLEALERHALENRVEAEARLLEPGADLADTESLHLFYTREEGEEIY